MRQTLLSGTTLVVDRYAYSGVAFTAAKKVSLNCINLMLLLLQLTLFCMFYIITEKILCMDYGSFLCFNFY